MDLKNKNIKTIAIFLGIGLLLMTAFSSGWYFYAQHNIKKQETEIQQNEKKSADAIEDTKEQKEAMKIGPYRAKSLSGKWWYGGLHKEGDKIYIETARKKRIEIKPETISENVGSIKNNGLYEGDVISFEPIWTYMDYDVLTGVFIKNKFLPIKHDHLTTQKWENSACNVPNFDNHENIDCGGPVHVKAKTGEPTYLGNTFIPPFDKKIPLDTIKQKNPEMYDYCADFGKLVEYNNYCFTEGGHTFGCAWDSMEATYDNAKILGNIWDNPDLLDKLAKRKNTWTELEKVAPKQDLLFDHNSYYYGNGVGQYGWHMSPEEWRNKEVEYIKE